MVFWSLYQRRKNIMYCKSKHSVRLGCLLGSHSSVSSVTMTQLLKKPLTRFIYALNQYSRNYSHFPGNFEPESWKSMEGLVRCSANHVPLSPLGFLERSSKAYRDNTSLVYGSLRYTWAETHQRCLKLASALTQLGISIGDVVSWLLRFISISVSTITSIS